MDDPTHSTLLVRLKDRNNADAWRTFDQLYRPLLLAYAGSRGLSPADAEDVAQQCTQALLEHIHEYQHLQSFKAWLRAIADHKIIDRRRRSHRQQDHASDFWNAQPQPDDPHNSPDNAWDLQWTQAHLIYCADRVRASVSESTYEAFAACVLRDVDPASVALSLNLSINQVYVAKHRVLERIRALMRELHGEDDIP